MRDSQDSIEARSSGPDIGQEAANPLLTPHAAPFGAPAFDAIRADHFMPAFRRAFADHAAEIAAIAANPAPADLENTILALERSGKLLTAVSAVFYNLVSAHSDADLLALESDIALLQARHWNAVTMNAALFERIAAVHAARDGLHLDAETLRLVERTWLRFRRAGAGLDEPAKARLAAINERLAELGTLFGHHVLADEQSWSLDLAEEDLAGLPPAFVEAARGLAEERGTAGGAVITLSRSFVEPFLQCSTRRDLREKVFRAFVSRGDLGGETDNNALVAEVVRLREESARLLDYATYAAYKLDDTMAKTPDAVRALLDLVWRPARARALADRDAMQALIAEEGGNFPLAPWDWRFYAEKLRLRRADFDDAAIKPYLALDAMIAAAFDVAGKLFGLTFRERRDVAVWHPDVRVWEVRGADGEAVGLFYGDYFTRPSKRSGAWMTSLRDQQTLDGAVMPLIVNVTNFTKGAAGEPSLLSPDDARTLFHEMGHALHGLLSQVTYPSFSGTSVLTDFVELPSQLYEHWQERPEVLKGFARHYRTGEPLPDDLLARFLKARKFNQGFATVEYVASALLDLAFHSLPADASADVRAFERSVMTDIGMPEEIVPRHRPQHFGHIFSGDGYAAGYYSYMWSEVMDADAFGAFEEAGSVFDSATAQRLKQAIYAAGGTRDPAAAYMSFRGRMPEPEALLRRRGLSDTSEAA
jgi:peptidyl-dipeptidase Dcp